MRRAVGVIRLSSLTEETTSPARQREIDEAWAKANDAEIIGWAEDLDVSAGIPPHLRPQLGEWMKRPEDYDLLIFPKLDRAVRALYDFVELDRWGQNNGVGLIIVDPPIDLTSMWGRMMAQVLAVFAEFEREMIKKRTKEGYEALVQNGWFAGGKAPYGHKAVKPDGEDHYRLVLDYEYVLPLRESINNIIKEISSPFAEYMKLASLGLFNNADGSPRPHTSFYHVLRSKSLIGQSPTSDGDVVRGKDGLPIERDEKIIDRQTYNTLQEILDDSGSHLRGIRKKASPLLRVAFCEKCESPLYARSTKYGQKRYTYYRCADRCYGSFPRKELEETVFCRFLKRVGDMEIQVKVRIKGNDVSEELEKAKANYQDILTLLQNVKSEAGRARLTQQLADLDETIAYLESQPVQVTRTEYRGTGQTYAEYWKTLNDQDRGSLLRESGVMAFVARKDKSPMVSLVLPDDLERQAQQWAANRSSDSV